MDQNQENPFPEMPSQSPKRSSTQPQYVPVYMPPNARQKTPKRSVISSLLRSVFIVIFICSLLLNVYLALLLSTGLYEQVYQTGDRKNKIALIDLQGRITMKSPDEMRRMFRRAAEDKYVKAVILVIDSPGGGVVPSDMITRHLQDFKKKRYILI